MINLILEKIDKLAKLLFFIAAFLNLAGVITGFNVLKPYEHDNPDFTSFFDLSKTLFFIFFFIVFGIITSGFSRLRV